MPYSIQEGQFQYWNFYEIGKLKLVKQYFLHSMIK